MMVTTRQKVTIVSIAGCALLYIFFSQKGMDTITVKWRSTNSKFIYSYRDLERDLCLERVDWTNKTLVHSPEGCPKKGVVSVVYGGRTGNLMWEYAAVWGVARHTGLVPYVPACIKSKLEMIFQELHVAGFKEIASCPVQLGRFVDSVENWDKFGSDSIILPRYIAQPDLVLKWTDDIVKEFQFKASITDAAENILGDLIKNLPGNYNYTFIGVHVRRTDYSGLLQRLYNSTFVDSHFFVRAMDHFRLKYSQPVFVYVSDDPVWCMENFGHIDDVFVVSNSTSAAAVDMAIMASCNHTIFDYGTFGEWGAILAGGETVCFNASRNRYKGKLLGWTLMD